MNRRINTLRRLRTLLLTGCMFVSASSSVAEEKALEVDLGNGDGGVVVLPSPDAGDKTAREVTLPEFERFVHVAADGAHIRWIAGHNRMFPWVGGNDLTSIFEERTPKQPRIPNPNRRALLMLFQLKSGKFLSVMPLSGEDSISWLETQKNGKLVVDYGTLGTKPVPSDSKVPLLAWSVNDNVYEAIAMTWKQVIDSGVTNGNLSLRYKKDYPEPLKYLGWCTWEQYKKSIDERILLSVFDGIENSGIPVRWVLIDDGHQTDKQLKLISMVPNKKKFPHGWDPIIARKDDDKVKWIGIWHGFLTHWRGVHVDHEMPYLAPYMMPNPKEKNGLLPKDNQEDSQAFYKAFMKVVKEQGFDFLKTDVVSRSTVSYYGSENPARAEMYNVRSLERACKEMGIGLMNCSAQNTIILLNATYSATMRTSPDYKKGDLPTSKSQILQSVFNVSWLGQTLWPDHDMFHSSDKDVGTAMAVTKAMSGGPIYLSDAPDDFNKEIILPLCYRDGLLLRPAAPGAPLPESIFTDALYNDSSAYKVIAPLNDQACAIAAYNVSLNSKATVSGVLSPDDYKHGSSMLQPYPGLWKVPAEGLVAYDWHEQTGKILDKDGWAFTIKGFGHKLFLLAPINHGWAMIGRPDKYLSPATTEIVARKKDSITFKMHEPAGAIPFCGLTAAFFLGTIR